MRNYPIKFSAPYISKSLHDLLRNHRTNLKEKWIIHPEDYSQTREIMRLIQLYALMVTISTCYFGGVIDLANPKMLGWMKIAIEENIKPDYKKQMLDFMTQPSLELGAELPMLSDMAMLYSQGCMIKILQDRFVKF